MSVLALTSTEESLRALEAIGRGLYPDGARSPARLMPVVSPPAVYDRYGLTYPRRFVAAADPLLIAERVRQERAFMALTVEVPDEDFPDPDYFEGGGP